MLYRIKVNPEDFIVHEQLTRDRLDTPLSSKSGETWELFLYIFFEKTNRNTMEVLLNLCESMGIMKKYVWVSWLKDKKAITRQWISIPQSAVDMVWGIDITIQLLNNQIWVEVLDTKRYNESLTVWWNEWNYFELRVRAQKDISETTKEDILEACKRIEKHWFPNYYWSQRFGKWLRNFKRAEKIISGEDFTPGQYVSKFILQAYGNLIFNRYASQRWLNKQYLLEWDIMFNQFHHRWAKVGYLEWVKINIVNTQELIDIEEPEWQDISNFDTVNTSDNAWWIPTWPLIGAGLVTPPITTPSWENETQIQNTLQFKGEKIQICQYYGMQWKRRPLWVTPQKFSYKFESDDLLFKFFLPTGSYATVLVGTIFEGIDEDTLIWNKLKIPK